MYVALEQFFLEDLKRPQRSLLRPEVIFQLDRVDRFDFPHQELQTRSDKRHGYDYLVTATGCVLVPGRIEGLKEADDYFYQYQPARQSAERLASLESGRVFITMSFPRTPNVPHQYGVAPVGTTLVLDDYLRRRDARERVKIVYTYPTTTQLLRDCLFLQRPTCEILPSLFGQHGARSQHGFILARVGPRRRIVYSEEDDEQPLDLFMATPSIRAMDAVRECDLSQTAADKGQLPTNHRALQVYGVDRVYTLDDTVDLPVGKAGEAYHNQVPVITSSITAEIRLDKPYAIYDGRVQAIVRMGLNTGMPLWYNYRYDVKPTPPTKLGGLLHQGFDRDLYWAVARGML